MKKVIALFSLTAMLAVGAVAAQAAGPMTTASGNDDTVIVNNVKTRNLRYFGNHQTYFGQSNTDVVINTGGNLRAAGDDLEGGQTTSGNATLTVNDTSEINTNDIWIDEPSSASSDDSTVSVTGNDDTALVQNSDQKSQDTFENSSTVFESDTASYGVDLGHNADLAGGDIENGATGISSGTATVTLNRNRTRNDLRITYGSIIAP